MTVGAGVFIGVAEAAENKAFKFGNLLVDEDDTILCYIDRLTFFRQVDERDIRRLVKSKDDVAHWP